MRFPFEVPAGEANKVRLGDDSDELASIDDGEAPELVRVKQPSRYRGGRRRGDYLDVLFHDHFDGDVLGHQVDVFAVRVTMADPRLEDAAVRDQADDALVPVNYGQVSDSAALDLPPRSCQGVADAQGFDDRRHELLNGSYGHSTRPKAVGLRGDANAWRVAVEVVTDIAGDLSICGVVDSFDADDASRQTRGVLLRVAQKVELRHRRAHDEKRLAAFQDRQHVVEEPRFILRAAMDVVVGGVHRTLVEGRTLDMEDSRLGLIDPDCCLSHAFR